MTKGSGAEARVGVASGRGGRGLLWPGSPVSSGRLLARALRRGVVVCVVLLVASFSFFLVTSSQRSGFYTRVIFTFHQAPEYIMDAMVPSINASLSTSHSSFTKNTGGGADVGDSEGNSSEEDQKGFLVRTPGCIIPDFDPFHHTITRFISNPINLVCKGPPALTSATRTTLYYHQDVLREHLDHFLNIYERKLASPISNTTTTKISHPPSTIRTGDNIPPTRPSNVSSHARPSDSSPSGAASEDAAQRADVDVYTDASGNSSSTDGAPPSPSPDDVSCCYRAIYRVEQKPEEYNGAADDRWRYSASCEPLTGAETTIHEEAVLVHCRMSNIVVYKNVHYFIQRARLLATPPATRDSNSSSTTGNQTVVDRAEHHNTTGTHGEDDAAPPPPTADHIQPDDAEKLSVIIFGTDSASRLNMRRHLPKTYKYLTEELGAVDLAGYNKVGDNTFPNLVPVLSGLSSDELVNHTCIPKKEKFDHCHWIWKDFKKKGYVTAFLEDSPWMGLFNYMRNGFVTKPTDYYGRPFFMASEQEIGNSKHGNSNACQGSKLSMKVVQEYSLEMARAFLDTPTFGMYWSASISHDYLNMLRHADLPHLQYLRQLREMGALNHTAIFFMSDHGMRFGSIRSTYVGMLEERLPYVLLYFPPWFRAKYHRALQNLRVNVRRLTANFDLYQTLNDLVFGRFANLTHVTSKPSPRTRGISLFQEIPRSRRCVDAGIPEHFCTCQDTREVTLDDPVLGLTADHLKATLNQDLAQYPACIKFKEVRVVTGRVSGSNKQLSPEDTSSDVRSYLVQAALYPGGVMVEATIRYNPYPELFQIAGEVSRINEYGNSSSCIHHSILRKFCFCKDHLTSQHHSLDDQPQQNQSQTEAAGRSVPTS